MGEKQDRGRELQFDDGIIPSYWSDGIIPIGWSKDGKFAYIDISNFKDDVYIEYVIIDTSTDKTVWSYRDMLSYREETKYTRQQSIQNYAKVISYHLNKYKIIQERGIKLHYFPFIYANNHDRFEVSLEIVKKTKAEMENSDEVFRTPIKSMTALIDRKSEDSNKEVLYKNDTGGSSYWVAGYFKSPFENKILVAIGRETPSPAGPLTNFIFVGYSLKSDFLTNP